jgi:hypothetical protein
MPRTPQGHKRPADVVSRAVRVMRIATGAAKEPETTDGKNKAAIELGRMGGMARAKALGATQRRQIARAAARSRWARKGRGQD